MKINEITTNVETSGDLLGQFFSIKDKGMMFDILRNRMYANPIKAICREISCNARDAHREIGKKDLPIDISVPTMIDKSFKIKDFGPGISPDRMKNIYLEYGSSTKNEDNNQTGGFGLGAKTPFSYTDTFSINTVRDGTQYNYSAIIDETRKGKVILLSSFKTDSPSGTEIIIPVKEADFYTFKKDIMEATAFWEIKPNFKNTEAAYPLIDKMLKGNGWEIYNDYNKMNIIVDGIKYDLNRNESFPSFYDIAISLYFNTGEISLAANREQIYYDQKTKDNINKRLDLLKSEVAEEIQNSLNGFDNFYKALSFYNESKKIPSSLKVQNTFKWQNLTISKSEDYPIENKVYSLSSASSKVYSCSYYRLHCDNDNLLIYNDLDVYDPLLINKYVKHISEKRIEKKFQIISCTKNQYDNYCNNYHLDKMNPLKLSDLISDFTVKKSNKICSVKFDIYLMNTSGMRRSSREHLLNDKNKKILCVFSDFHSKELTFLNKKISDSLLSNVLLKSPDLSFYAVKSEFKDKMSKLDKFINLEDFLSNYLLENKSFKIEFFNSRYMTEPFLNVKPLLKNNDSKYLKLIETYHRVMKLKNDNFYFLKNLNTIVNGDFTDDDEKNFFKENKEYDFASCQKDIDDTYPLLRELNYHTKFNPSNAVAHYINLIDESLKANK